MINKRGLKSFIGINTINDNEPKYITRTQKRKANRLKRILEEKPELNFKPSIKLIPDMPKYQTPEERARFLMSRFKYTEIPLDYYDYDLPSGLYITKDSKGNILGHIYKSDLKICIENNKYILSEKNKVIRIFNSLIELYKNLFLDCNYIKWQDVFDLYKLIGISKNDVRKYDKYSKIPENKEGLNKLLKFREEKELLKKAAKEEKEQKQKNIVKIKRIKSISSFVRSRTSVNIVLDRDNHTCQINSSHITFKSGTTSNQYVEVHHLIPMKYQDKYDFDLDLPYNMFSLCPMCHAGIHFGNKEVIKTIVTQLYNLRVNTLPLRLDQILELYYK